MNTTQLHWLAGILEGEGSFGCYKSDKLHDYFTPTIQLIMTDADVVLKVASYIGGNSHKEKIPNRGTKHPYKVSISGERAIRLMIQLYPLMGERRRSKIAEVLSIYLSIDYDTACIMLRKSSIE